MDEYKNLEKLPQEVKTRVGLYLHDLLDVYPGQVESVAVYGSAVSGEYVPGRSNINLVIVLKELGFDQLHQALKVVAQGVKQRISTPLVLTKKYISSSVDVFPIEFLDIKENHVLVYGEDVFASLHISQENLRLFCEHEIKGKLVRIRQAYLEKGLNASAVEELLKESLHALLPVFRNLIRLKNGVSDFNKNTIIVTLARVYHIDGKVFETILHHRTQRLKISLENGQVLMTAYLLALESLAAAVDQL